MFDDMEPLHFKPGDFIFNEGDAPIGVYLISKGKVQIFKTKGGEQISLGERGFNEIFGEMALIDNEDRSASAKALEDTWCYMLSPSAFNKKLQDADPFIRGIVKMLVKSLRTTTETHTTAKAKQKGESKTGNLFGEKK